MRDDTKRLHEAARELKGISGQSEIARLLWESPQTVKNWESRGVPFQLRKSGIDHLPSFLVLPPECADPQK